MASNFDVQSMVGSMMGAAMGVFKTNWNIVKPYAENELLKFAQDLLLIESLNASHQITPERAKLHVEMQKNSMRAVLLAIEGIGILTVEEAINAAFSVVSQTVNKSLGFVLL
jgi:hypothetical protein